MRSSAGAESTTIEKLCKECGLVREHRPRADDPTKPRSACLKCSAELCKRWRKTGNWQRSKLYETWRGILDRCLNRRNMNWPRYGGAHPPITVTKRWQGRDGFAVFLRDIPPPPSREHSLDRRRPRRGYSKGNVRWATREEQARNRKTSRVFTLPDPLDPAPYGRQLTLCVAEWARFTALLDPPATPYPKARAILSRLARGWEPWRAVFVPVKPKLAPVPF